MSAVTNIIMTFSVEENETEIIKMLNRFVYRDSLAFDIKSVEDSMLPSHWYGGTKNLELNVLIGAFNHLDIDVLVEFIKSLHWEAPTDVRLFIKTEEQSAMDNYPIAW